MAYTGTVSEQISIGGMNLMMVNTVTGGHRQGIDETVASDAEDNLEMAYTLDVSETKMLFISSSQAMTIKTNATGEGADNTLVLKAGIPYVWFTDKEDALVFDTDIVKIFVTNDSDPAVEAALHIEAIVDPTPPL